MRQARQRKPEVGYRGKEFVWADPEIGHRHDDKRSADKRQRIVLRRREGALGDRVWTCQAAAGCGGRQRAGQGIAIDQVPRGHGKCQRRIRLAERSREVVGSVSSV